MDLFSEALRFDEMLDDLKWSSVCKVLLALPLVDDLAEAGRICLEEFCRREEFSLSDLSTLAPFWSSFSYSFTF